MWSHQLRIGLKLGCDKNDIMFCLFFLFHALDMDHDKQFILKEVNLLKEKGLLYDSHNKLYYLDEKHLFG